MKKSSIAILIAFFIITALFVYQTAHAKNTKETYVGQGRYTCQGDRSECRRFEARERARQDERSYQNERLEQERRRDRERFR